MKLGIQQKRKEAIMLSPELLSMKITHIIVLLARRLDISSERALQIFYESDTNERLHNPDTGLYLMGDLYIVDDVIREIQEMQL